MAPLVLGANTPRTFYRGSGQIFRFRGVPVPDDPYFPEDWVASTTARFGLAPSGLTVLPGGETLADAVAADPEAWLGPEHVARHGANPAVLVKLLDAGQRLPVHVHPDRAYATAHLASPYGKTEAWVIVDAVPDAAVYLGFTRDVAADELAGWVRGQRVTELLAATNRIPVRAGDAVLVPAGLPHAIGEGVFLVEVQEPTDFSVLLEGVEGVDSFLGLDLDEALSCVDRGGWSPARVAELHAARRAGRGVRPGVDRLFPEAADEFFAAERLRPDPACPLDPGFSVLVVLDGQGQLAHRDGKLPVAKGDTVVIPFAAGRCELTGDVSAVRCLPN